MSLDWRPEPPGKGEWGYSGSLVIAMVGQRDTGRWYWVVNEVFPPRPVHHRGETKDRATAKRAADRAWCQWLEAAALKPVGERKAP